ncbi:acyl-CoA thioesterase [Nocardioides marmoribigeumensis]|uniref:Acyl-CoA thioesterase-2 n=1 Tax=Nocardioides marmoribigeumensis TaxID=433649 RepID=A0ABU2BR61_9ACTN|nr:acyl-CoA thioesterase II [Nocardioides marmoribigeumensis]MDR7361133.1 acyl-CoA thioesterase-2 [Nocardioides marmoribigeumensis]
MPSSAAELVELLDLETIDLNLFRGKQPDTQMQRTFGGQVAAQALVAAARTAPEETEVHSLHSYFLRPGDPTVPLVYDVERVRDGRSFATRRVLARQHGRPIFGLTASFQIEEEGWEHQDVIPDVPGPEDSFDVTEWMANDPQRRDEWLREWSVMDLRLARREPARGEEDTFTGPTAVDYWIRIKGGLPDEPLVHQAALTYLSDLTLLGATLVKHQVHPGHRRVQAASLDHAIWFHRDFRADDWLLYSQTSPIATGARGLAFGHLFTVDGRMVATVAQEGLIRPRHQD